MTVKRICLAFLCLELLMLCTLFLLLPSSLGYQGLSFNTDSYNSTHLLSTAELFQSNTSPSTLGRYLRIRLLDFNTSIGGQTDRYYGIAEVIVNGRCDSLDINLPSMHSKLAAILLPSRITLCSSL